MIFLNLEELGENILRERDKTKLGKLTQSESGAQLASRFDGKAVEDAARKGDMQALSSMLREILSTPEGKRFAEDVRRAVKSDER